MTCSKSFSKFVSLCAGMMFLIPSSLHALTINSINIQDHLLKSPTSSVFISMAESTESVIEKINLLTFPSEGDKAFTVVQALQAHTRLTQAPLQGVLTLMGVRFQSFWITNQIHIKDAFPALLLGLMKLFPGKIASINEETMIPMMTVFDEQEGVKPQTAGSLWGLKALGARDSWTQGMEGQGVRVAVLDTGCLANHVELINKVILWKDSVLGTLSPNDLDGHGTHVCGTIAGTNVGMAPKASLIVCKACGAVDCREAHLTTCAEYVFCPDPPGCTMRPHVVSCSWGGDGGNKFFQKAINAWRAVGIIPVFAFGNSGPGCNTAGSPGDYNNVIGVVAIDKFNNVAPFSSRGPGLFSSPKPDVSAPGVDITSCSFLSTDGYRVLSGTSMACPHIMSNGNKMTFDQLLATLIASCSTNLVSSGSTCGNKSDSIFPNFIYGNGKPFCANTIQIMKQQHKQKQQKVQDFEDFDTEVAESENMGAAKTNDFPDFDM